MVLRSKFYQHGRGHSASDVAKNLGVNSIFIPSEQYEDIIKHHKRNLPEKRRSAHIIQDRSGCGVLCIDEFDKNAYYYNSKGVKPPETFVNMINNHYEFINHSKKTQPYWCGKDYPFALTCAIRFMNQKTVKVNENDAYETAIKHFPDVYDVSGYRQAREWFKAERIVIRCAIALVCAIIIFIIAVYFITAVALVSYLNRYWQELINESRILRR